jgi:hypothetical protein
MTTKTSKASKASSKKTTTLHIATPGSGKPICGAAGKGIKTTLTAAEANCSDCAKVAAHAEEKKTNEAKTTKGKKVEQPEVKKAAQPTAEPRERDPRLPPVGTTLTKRDRAGNIRCECLITATGFEYKGTEYRSLSGAAMAAAKDLGVKGAINGWLWFGLAKPSARIADPAEVLASAWDRFHERASRAFDAAKDDSAALAKLKATVAGQVKKLEQFAE